MVQQRSDLMDSEYEISVWVEKGATLSDKTAQKEFGLTRQEIVEAIRGGKLQYRENNIYGNPFLRLIRREVEALVKEKYGSDYLKQKKLKTELAAINRTLRALKTQTTSLETRKAELLRLVGDGILPRGAKLY
jgi:hypothetical protein